MKKRLLLNGIINGSKSSDDLRVMLYDLSDKVRQIVEGMHRETDERDVSADFYGIKSGT